MTAEEFLSKFPETEACSNCMADLACPECGERSLIRVCIEVWADVYDSGSEVTGDHEWDGSSRAYCCTMGCDYGNCSDRTVSDFHIEGLDDLIRKRKGVAS
jgi:hypothetical protein